MWELVTRRDFKRELARFLGPGKVSWTVPDTEKTEQVLLTLAVSADGPVRLSDGTLSLGGCFPHNCPERAQVFFATTGEIKAVALLYHDCVIRNCSGDEDFTLRILVRQKSASLEAHARDWASSELRRDTELFPQLGPNRVASTVVQVLTN